MLSSLLFLAATSTAPSPVTPLPNPEQPGYSSAKAFVAIVKRDAEVDLQPLNYAFGMPELYGKSLTWFGPLSSSDLPRSSAVYDPPKSSIGMDKIIISWDYSLYFQNDGKPGVGLRLTVFFHPESCPKEAELVEATGVAMEQGTALGLHGGPSYRVRWFDLLNDKGERRRIDYNPVICELTASFVRER